jgi:hypothetical protein
MKLLLTILFFLSLTAHATNYYVSNTGSDAAAGTSTGTAWATVAKVNSVWAAGTFAPGDSIFFKRGNSWTGTTLVPAEDGTSGARIFVGAYDSGADPIISGATTVTSWESLGGNLYRSTAAISTLNTLNMLTIDGVQYAMGRYPNAGSANNGYLKFESRTSDSVIFDNETLSSTINWTGARAVIRVNAFFLDTSIIETHSGNRFDLTSSKITSLIAGYGFFIQNDVRTLDQHGEWFYDITTKKLTIYLSTAPSNYSIKASTIDNLVTLSSDDYITFRDIDFQYANDIGLSLTTSTNITIQECSITFCGNKAISSRSSGSNNLVVRGNFISDCGNYGVDGRGMGSNRVVSNTIKKIGLFPGMGGFALGVSSQHRYAIHCDAVGSVLDSNRIDSVAYVGIRFYGNNSTVQYNHISNFCMVMQDGSAIYSYNGCTDTNCGTDPMSGRMVKYNIVRDGVGSPEGTTVTYRKAYGIYLDDNSSGVEVHYNTVFNTPSWGFDFHNTYNIDSKYNTVYNCEGEASAPAQVIFNDDDIHPKDITGMVFKHNILVARTSSQKTLYLYSGTPSAGTINGMGTIDSNYYARPVSDSMILTGRSLGGSVVQYSRTSWKAAYNHDDVSPYSPVTFTDADSTDYYIVFIYNPTNADSTVDLIDGASYTAVTGDDYSESVILDPYTSLVLLRTPDPPPPPPAPTQKIYKHTNGKVIKTPAGKILVKPAE